MAKVIQIEVPDEVEALMRSNPLIKLVIERMVGDKIKEYLLTMLTMDKLTEESELTEEDIIELEKDIKKSIRQRIENEIGR